jgi:hypothetical protein
MKTASRATNKSLANKIRIISDAEYEAMRLESL